MRYFYILLLILVPLSSYATNVVNVGQLAISPSGPSLISEKIDLGKESWRGVDAHVYLTPQPDLDLKQPLSQGSHYFLLSVEFARTGSDESMLAGQAAVRTFGVNKRATQTVRLEPQDGQWTAPVLLDTRGETLIKIGSKLADGKKRIYRFFFNQPSIETPGPLIPLN